MSRGVVSVRAIARDDLPREKFADKGAGACSDADLLAILMGTGRKGESVLDLAERILADCDNSLANLQRMSLDQLKRYKGIGPVKALTIKAAAELTQRRLDEAHDKRRQITCSADLFEYFERTYHVSDLAHEEVFAVFTNRSHRVIRTSLIGRGGLNEVAVDIRLVIRDALVCDATSVALCHNHPGGNVKPSAQDDKMTIQLKEACKVMNITLIDHIIVGDSKRYYSYCDEGKI